MNKLKKHLRTPTETEIQNLKNDLNKLVISSYLLEICLFVFCLYIFKYIREIDYRVRLPFIAIWGLFLFIELCGFIKEIKAVKSGDYLLGECKAVKYEFRAMGRSLSIHCETTALLIQNQHIKIKTIFDEEYAEEAFLRGNKTFTLFLIKNEMYAYLKLDNGKTFTSKAEILN